MARSTSRKRKLPKWKPKPLSSKRQRTSRATRLNMRNSSHSLLHLRGFARQMDRTAGMPEWLANTPSSIAKTRAGEQQYRQRLSCTIPSRSAGPSTCRLSHQMRCGVECWVILPTCAMCRSREQARGQCRLATEHEQSAAHNEDDDGRGAATRGHQGSPAEKCRQTHDCHHQRYICHLRRRSKQRHIPNTGGLNITGRMAELDYPLLRS